MAHKRGTTKGTAIVVTLLGLAVIVAGRPQADQTTSSVALDDLINNIFNTNKNNDRNANPNPTTAIFNPTPPTRSPPFQPQPTQTTVLNPDPHPGQSPYKSCGVQKECVPRFQCENGDISTAGVNIIDIRVNTDEPCDYLETCCNIPNTREMPVITPKPPITHEGCGFRNPDGVGFRITGDSDNEAQFGEFPWMVAVLREEQAPTELLNLYECGGTLIAPNVVITAAHCVQNRKASQMLVRAGEWDTQTHNEILPFQDRRVVEIILHENFHKGALFNDIAILLVDSDFALMENVRPLCLPQATENFDHSRCFATGWGKDTFGAEGKYQVILKKIDLPVVPNEQCQANLRRTRLGAYFSLDKSFICAGGEKDKDTCKGDGGSPLMCPINTNGQYALAGIVAWGIGCGVENVPGVYANVAHLRPWIDEKLAAKRVAPGAYTP